MTGAERYRLVFHLDGAPDMNTPATRRHHQVAAGIAARWRLYVTAVAKPAPPEPLQLARVVLIRRSSVQPDTINLAQSMKPILDGLQPSTKRRRGKTSRLIPRANVIIDDSPRHIIDLYAWEAAPPSRTSIEVRVDALTPYEFAVIRNRLHELTYNPVDRFGVGAPQ